MHIEKRPFADGVVYLCLAGELDIATSDQLYDAVVTTVCEGRATRVVIDLAALSFCDSIGIGALLRAPAMRLNAPWCSSWSTPGP